MRATRRTIAKLSDAIVHALGFGAHGSHEVAVSSEREALLSPDPAWMANALEKIG